MDQKYSDQADGVIAQMTTFMRAHPKTTLVIVAAVIVVAIWVF